MRITSQLTICLVLLGFLLSGTQGQLVSFSRNYAPYGYRSCQIIQSDYLLVYSCEDYSHVRLLFSDSTGTSLQQNGTMNTTSHYLAKFTTNYTNYAAAVYNRTAAINYDCTNMVTFSASSTDLVNVGLNFTLSSPYCGPTFLTSSYIITHNLVDNSNIAISLSDTTNTPISLSYVTPIDFLEPINNPVSGTPSSSFAIVSNCKLDIISISANGSTMSQLNSGPFDLSTFCLCDSIGSMTSDRLIKYLAISCTNPNTPTSPMNLTQLLFRFDLVDPLNQISLIYTKDFVADSNFTLVAGSTNKFKYYASISTYLDVSLWAVSLGNMSVVTSTIYEPISRIMSPLYQINQSYVYSNLTMSKFPQLIPFLAGKNQMLYINYYDNTLFNTLLIPMCFPKYSFLYYNGWFPETAGCKTCASDYAYYVSPSGFIPNAFGVGYQNFYCYQCSTTIKFNNTNYTGSSINLCNNVTQCTLPSGLNSVLTSTQSQNYMITPYNAKTCMANCSDPFTLSGGVCTMKTTCSQITTCLGCFSNSACSWSNGACSALVGGSTATTQTLSTISSTCSATEYCTLTSTKAGIFVSAPGNNQSARTLLCKNSYSFNLTGNSNSYTISVSFLNSGVSALNTGEVIQVVNSSGGVSLVNFTGSSLNYTVDGSLTTVQIWYFKPSGVAASSLLVSLTSKVVVQNSNSNSTTNSTNTNTGTNTNTTTNTTAPASTTCQSDNNCLSCLHDTKNTCYWDYSLGSCSSVFGSNSYSSDSDCLNKCIVYNIVKKSYGSGQVVAALAFGPPASLSSSVMKCAVKTFKVSDFYSNITQMAFILLGNTTQTDDSAEETGATIKVTQSSIGTISFPTWTSSNMLLKLTNLTGDSTITLEYESSELGDLENFDLVVAAVTDAAILPGYGFPATAFSEMGTKYMVSTAITTADTGSTVSELPSRHNSEKFEETSTFLIIVIAIPSAIAMVLIFILMFCCLKKRALHLPVANIGPAPLEAAKDITSELINVKEYPQFREENCPVCLEPFTGIARFYPCNVHVSHTGCYTLWAASAPAKLNGFLCVYRCTAKHERPVSMAGSCNMFEGPENPMPIDMAKSNIHVVVDNGSRAKLEYEQQSHQENQEQEPEEEQEVHIDE